MSVRKSRVESSEREFRNPIYVCDTTQVTTFSLFFLSYAISLVNYPFLLREWEFRGSFCLLGGLGRASSRKRKCRVDTKKRKSEKCAEMLFC